MKSTFNIADIGQSNSSGTPGPINPLFPSPIPDPAKAWEYLFTQVGTSGGNGSFVSLRDPMNRDKVGTRKSNTGSSGPALAQRLLELGAERVNLTGYGVSGTAASTVPNSTGNNHWGATGVLRERARLQFQKMLDAQGAGTKLDWLRIDLGETDFFVNLTKYSAVYAPFPDGYICAEYPTGYPNPANKVSMYELYRDLILFFQGNFPGLKVLINATGTWAIRSAAERDNGALARVVQRELAATMPDVFFCDLPVTFSVANGRISNHDNLSVHRSQQGLNELGVADAEIIVAVESEAAIAPL